MVIDLIPITDDQRKKVHELLDTVLDACVKGESHVFFWMGNADSRSPAYISHNDGKEKLEAFLSFTEEDMDEAKGVIKNGNNTAKREFWHIQSTGR